MGRLNQDCRQFWPVNLWCYLQHFHGANNPTLKARGFGSWLTEFLSVWKAAVAGRARGLHSPFVLGLRLRAAGLIMCPPLASEEGPLTPPWWPGICGVRWGHFPKGKASCRKTDSKAN